MIAGWFELLLSPTRYFMQAETKSSGRAAILLATIFASTLALVIIYYFSVDIDWLREQLMGRLPADRREIVAKFITKEFLLLGAAIGGVARIAIWVGVLATYFYVLDRVRGGQRLFGRWLYFVALSQMPLLLLLPIGAAATFLAPARHIMPDELDTTSLNHLALGLTGGPWKSFFEHLSLIQLWALFLQIVGFSVWTKASAARSILWAGLPTFLFCTGWFMLILASNR